MSDPGAGRIGETAAQATGGPAVVLVRPQLGVNIGTAIRAMANFGLDDLRIVAPRAGWPNDHASAAAAGAEDHMRQIKVYPELSAAIGDCNWICASTARQRELSTPVLTPEMMAKEMSRRSKDGQRCAVLFGAERSGLSNDDLAMADGVVMIPVVSAFASLNLAQAVLLIGYEWMKQAGGASLGRVTLKEQPIETGFQAKGAKPASKQELNSLFEHLEAELDAKGFLYPPEKRPTMVRNIRTMLTRMGATEPEVRTLRGIIAALARGKGHWRRPP